MSKKAPSRRERFDEAMGLVEDGKSRMEELRDELQNWLDNMPENLQQSSKAEELEEAISNLDSIIDYLESATGESVDFPGMR